jgi:hypothetical protein
MWAYFAPEKPFKPIFTLFLDYLTIPFSGVSTLKKSNNTKQKKMQDKIEKPTILIFFLSVSSRLKLELLRAFAFGLNLV